MTVRVVVADDHFVFREGIRALLAGVPGIEVTGEAGTADEAVAAVAEHCPDVVLMDLSMPGGGLDAIRRLATEHPDVRVLVLTMHADDAFLRQALRAGARGYLLKDAGPDEIVRAIRAVAAGQAILDAGVAASAFAMIGRPEPSPFPALTDRERDVLDRLVRGQSNEAIAARLGVTLKTVQNYVSAVLVKIGARDRAHAVAVVRDQLRP